ncbi:MAG: hypothetical protein CSA95_04655 [Bacteroidetes bacterium]|nr:MAG: hypothetical protein CSA95_04655 [Bacteroidota bacterium]PIE88097.1 MAG: hypothetical protein CSA04_03640 [Bacteroidota bacterium]
MKNIYLFWVILAFPILAFAQLPDTYDLRNVDGASYVTSVKSQQGGTCWTHGTMASIEGNLMITNIWEESGETGEPALAEYHLDWWNGFNQYNNDDLTPPSGSGLEVHMGGDYRVATAYLSRGEGAVREIDGQQYENPPQRHLDSYHYFYPRTVEWYTIGDNLENINTIKQKIMDHGVIATCMFYDNAFINWDYIHYQPPTDPSDPNHSVAIIGWDDNLVTQAPEPGAWLCKNSWGTWWGNNGYFWISYYDKHACRNVEMGAISFQEVEPMKYEKVFYHDYHGWRDQLEEVTTAANRFELNENCILEAVSFFSNAENVDYTVTIFKQMGEDGPEEALAEISGNIEHIGFHTFDLPESVELMDMSEFVIQLELSDGGIPYDRTSDIPVLLGAPNRRTIVESTAAENQSFYLNPEDGLWKDFYNYEDPSGYEHTGNFCIKGLCTTKGVGVNRYSSTKENLKVYPNPVESILNLTFDMESAGHAVVIITDMAGRQVADISTSVTQGNNTLTMAIDRSTIKPGFYTIRVENETHVISRSSIIVK